MSTTEVGRLKLESTDKARADVASWTVWDAMRLAFAPLASLQLTVVLLGLAFVLVLAGTLAQVDYDVWYVVAKYFRSWWALIELRIFFPRNWGISEAIRLPFPGGKLIGCGLALNLLAAHGFRFRVAASGARLWWGWAVIALGAAMTWGVIASGSNIAASSQLSPQFANTLWHLVRAALGGTALTLCYVLALTRVQSRESAARWLWWFGVVAAVLLVGLAGYLFMHPEERLDASGLRILWQLAKAGGAGVVLGLGCWAVFARRAGIVLLHGGIALLMFSELYTDAKVVEAQMTIEEGETATWAQDIRAAELAFTQVGDSELDRVVVIPAALLAEAARSGEPVRHPELPVDVRVVEYLPNAGRRLVQPGETGVATAGLGQLWALRERPRATGVANESRVDVPGAYVELLDKDTGASLGVYLTSLHFAGEPLEVDGQPWQMALRFKRLPKPYRVTLNKFKFDRYIGSPTPKNFESIVRFEDPAHNVDYNASIWMNNPLRYGGDTLYQADWNKETERGTVLQVVTNSGWMIPYVSCMIVLAGMLIHFLQALVRFIGRRENAAARAAAAVASASRERLSLWSQWRRPQV
ncbi:MAG TPA: cytochrome c biogenesis protein ResB, partial [Lacipirellulaceae bacterium]|nr:cytochrome c biogenesis protein ResB [Lacipirellulaceae bacterium]